MDDILEFIYDIMPPWMATSIFIALGAGAGIGGAVWHSHEQSQIAACNTSQGVVTQVVSSNARVDCGSASLLSKVALVLEIGGFVVMGIFIIVWLVLAAKGKLVRDEK